MTSFFPRTLSSTPGALHLQSGTEPSPGYRLVRVRGRGGFADVWEATDPAGRPVALKFMPSSHAGTTARELRALQAFMAMDHPNLVRTTSVWTVPGYIVIGMELAEATLLDLMMVYHHDLGQVIDVPLLCGYLWQVAEALDFLNARTHTRDGRKVGFQHGDVKPNNVLVFGEMAKLTDYGLATPTHGATTPCPRHGTREYSPPEVFLGHLTDQSDQYSLAVSYCVLRTGGFPFPPPPTDMTMSYLRPRPDLRGLLPAEQTALTKGLSHAPQGRFPTCRDLARALLRAHGLGPQKGDDGVWRAVPDADAVGGPHTPTPGGGPGSDRGGKKPGSGSTGPPSGRPTRS